MTIGACQRRAVAIVIAAIVGFSCWATPVHASNGSSGGSATTAAVVVSSNSGSGSGSSGSSGSGSSGSGSSGSGSGSPGTTEAGSGSGSGRSGKGPEATTRTTVTEQERPEDGDATTTSKLPVSSIPAAPPSTGSPPAATLARTTLKPEPSTTEKPLPVEQRFQRSSNCGTRSLTLDVRVDTTGIRVRSLITPKTSTTWAATLLHDRRIAWKGAIRGGSIDQRLVNLPGSEVVSVRLTDVRGAICAAELTVPT